MRELSRGALLSVLFFALLIGAPAMASDTSCTRVEVEPEWVPHPWSPSCFLRLVAFLVCRLVGPFTPDDPPHTTVEPIYGAGLCID